MSSLIWGRLIWLPFILFITVPSSAQSTDSESTVTTVVTTTEPIRIHEGDLYYDIKDASQLDLLEIQGNFYIESDKVNETKEMNLEMVHGDVIINRTIAEKILAIEKVTFIGGDLVIIDNSKLKNISLSRDLNVTGEIKGWGNTASCDQPMDRKIMEFPKRKRKHFYLPEECVTIKFKADLTNLTNLNDFYKAVGSGAPLASNITSIECINGDYAWGLDFENVRIESVGLLNITNCSKLERFKMFPNLHRVELAEFVDNPVLDHIMVDLDYDGPTIVRGNPRLCFPFAEFNFSADFHFYLDKHCQEVKVLDLTNSSSIKIMLAHPGQIRYITEKIFCKTSHFHQFNTPDEFDFFISKFNLSYVKSIDFDDCKGFPFMQIFNSSNSSYVKIDEVTIRRNEEFTNDNIPYGFLKARRVTLTDNPNLCLTRRRLREFNDIYLSGSQCAWMTETKGSYYLPAFHRDFILDMPLDATTLTKLVIIDQFSTTDIPLYNITSIDGGLIIENTKDLTVANMFPNLRKIISYRTDVPVALAVWNNENLNYLDFPNLIFVNCKGDSYCFQVKGNPKMVYGFTELWQNISTVSFRKSLDTDVKKPTKSCQTEKCPHCNKAIRFKLWASVAEAFILALIFLVAIVCLKIQKNEIMDRCYRQTRQARKHNEKSKRYQSLWKKLEKAWQLKLRRQERLGKPMSRKLKIQKIHTKELAIYSIDRGYNEAYWFDDIKWYWPTFIYEAFPSINEDHVYREELEHYLLSNGLSYPYKTLIEDLSAEIRRIRAATSSEYKIVLSLLASVDLKPVEPPHNWPYLEEERNRFRHVRTMKMFDELMESTHEEDALREKLLKEYKEEMRIKAEKQEAVRAALRKDPELAKRMWRIKELRAERLFRKRLYKCLYGSRYRFSGYGGNDRNTTLLRELVEDEEEMKIIGLEDKKKV